MVGEAEEETRKMKSEIVNLKQELEMEKKKKSVEWSLQLDLWGVI